VIATAPLVIDTLNFPVQMKHQKETWGFYSEQIQDYTSKGLVREDGIPRVGRESTLWKMMDPYSYRAQLKMPKLLVVGSNDRYWSVDAMNLYWDDLVGEKHIHRVPNAGHGLDGGKDNALRTLGTFFRLSASGKSLPEFKWMPNVTEDEIGLTMLSTDAPKAVRLWVARSESTDFRDAKWLPTELAAKDGNFVGNAKKTPKDHVAVFGEAEYEQDGANYQLSTLVFWK
jgi:PhoPQ-activated pathogenicity-related protein